MTSYVRDVVASFSSLDNKLVLYSALVARLGSGRAVNEYLREHLDDAVRSFIPFIEGNLRMNVAAPSVRAQVGYFNSIWIQNQAQLIAQTISHAPDTVYVLEDSDPVRSLSCPDASADTLLRRWSRTVVSHHGARDDRLDGSPHCGAHQRYASVPVGDSIEGYNYHVGAFENPIAAALNRAPEYEKTAFGVSNGPADARLMGRRTHFDRPIRRREVGLHRHNTVYGTDLESTEMGCMNRGHSGRPMLGSILN